MESSLSLRLFLAFFFFFFIISPSIAYNNFYVGDKEGWVLNPSEEYNHWAGRNRFQVNDTLIFKYKEGSDSVLVVKKDDYYSCNTKNALRILRSGSSVFQFDRSGPFFFISGNQDHCKKGQKLTVVVLAIRPKSTSPPPPKTPSPVSSPPSTLPKPPSPTAQTPSTPPPATSPVSPSPKSPTFAPIPATSPVSPSPVSLSPVSPSPVSYVPTMSPTPTAAAPSPMEKPPSEAPSQASSPISPNPSAAAPGGGSAPAPSPGEEGGGTENLNSPAPSPSASWVIVCPSSLGLFLGLLLISALMAP